MPRSLQLVVAAAVAFLGLAVEAEAQSRERGFTLGGGLGGPAFMVADMMQRAPRAERPALRRDRDRDRVGARAARRAAEAPRRSIRRVARLAAQCMSAGLRYDVDRGRCVSRGRTG